MTFRSLLFVPGSRPERFEKAIASGADAICIDLEDAVAPADREKARENLSALLSHERPERPAIGTRINGLRTADGVRDLNAVLGWRFPDFIMIAKADYAEDVGLANELFGGKKSVVAAG